MSEAAANQPSLHGAGPDEVSSSGFARPPRSASTPSSSHCKLPDLAILAFVALGGLGLVVCLEGRREDVPWIVLSAVIAVGSEELTRLIFGERGAPLLAGFIIGVAAYAYARLPGVAITMILPGLRQLTPGFLGTQATFQLLTAGQSTSTASLFDVVLVALQLGIGITAAGLIFKKRRGRIRPTSAAPT